MYKYFILEKCVQCPNVFLLFMNKLLPHISSVNMNLNFTVVWTVIVWLTLSVIVGAWLSGQTIYRCLWLWRDNVRTTSWWWWTDSSLGMYWSWLNGLILCINKTQCCHNFYINKWQYVWYWHSCRTLMWLIQQCSLHFFSSFIYHSFVL